jgi:hypothetical protein
VKNFSCLKEGNQSLFETKTEKAPKEEAIGKQIK